MAATREDLPENIDALKAVLLVERARAVRVEAELAVAKAKASDDDALIAHQRLQIEKLTRQLFGLEPAHDFEPRDVRKPYVQNNQLGMMLAGQVDRRCSRAGTHNPVALKLQHI